jgi:dipeptidyl aminopeptidase/acylaminoacyl peptidase
MRAIIAISASLIVGAGLLGLSAVRADTKPPDKPAAQSLEGFWQGTLKAGVVELRLVLRITPKPGGAFAGVLDSPDEGLKGIPISEITSKDGSVRLELKTVKAVFEGKWSKEGSEIAGNWMQSGQSFPVTFKRLAKPPEVSRPQEPKKPYPYVEEEVAFENQKAGLKRTGALTLPPGKGPFPAVVLIPGSGAHNRDEAVFGHRPFLVLADYLTRRGVAVLRVDDRGVGGSAGDKFKATCEDLAEDALAGVAFLKGRKEIAPAHIGLIGHSEGGIIAPMAAVQSNDVAFIVLLAGTGLPGEEGLYLQGKLILKAMGVGEEQLARQRRLQERLFAVLKQEKDNTVAEKKLRAVIEDEVAKLSEEEKKAAGAQKTVPEAQIKMMLTPWFRYFLAYDPRPVLRKVRCPVLALNGEKDVQVGAKEHLEAIGKALQAGGNKDYTIKEVPKLNHLFQTCQTGGLSEYPKIEETIAPVVLEIMADWIEKHTKAAAPGSAR